MRSNLFIGAGAGLLIGLLALPIIANLQSAIPLRYRVIGVFVLIGLVPLGLFIAQILSRWIPVMEQLAKFIVVGALNTLIDLGVLNLLIVLSGVAGGVLFSIFKGISFLVAVINSYFWNARWTFKIDGAELSKTKPKQFMQFFIVSAIGLFINVATASIVVNVLGRPERITPEQWANLGAVAAVVISLVWNFLGYKYIVFSEKKLPATY